MNEKSPDAVSRSETGKDLTNYTTTQLAKLIGVPVREIHAYIERNYISPSIQDANGHGSSRLWSQRDALHAALLSDLYGVINTGTMRELSEKLRDALAIGSHIVTHSKGFMRITIDIHALRTAHDIKHV